MDLLFNNTVLYIIFFLSGVIIGFLLKIVIKKIVTRVSIKSQTLKSPSYDLPLPQQKSYERYITFYPVVEILNGIFYMIALYKFGITSYTFIYLLFISSIIVITFINLDFKIIPDVITLPGILVGLIASPFILIDPFYRLSTLGLKASIIGAILGFGLYYLIAVLTRGGIGGGDIKMITMIGSFLGWKGALLTTFIGIIIFLGYITVHQIFKGKIKSTKIQTAPFYMIGALATIFWGEDIIQFYH